MTTVTYQIGDDWRLAMDPQHDDGTAPDLSGVTGRLEISAPRSCHIISLIPTETGFDLPLNPETTEGLPPRAYRTVLVLEWPDGTSSSEAGLVLNIQRTC